MYLMQLPASSPNFLVWKFCGKIETMRKLCLSTKFQHQENKWNYGIFRNANNTCFIDMRKKLHGNSCKLWSFVVHAMCTFMSVDSIDQCLAKRKSESLKLKITAIFENQSFNIRQSHIVLSDYFHESGIKTALSCFLSRPVFYINNL